MASKSFNDNKNEGANKSPNGRPAEISRHSMSIQTKLTVGDANDSYEREADSVASSVMSMTGAGFVQRKCADCEKEEAGKVQRKPLTNAITRLQTKSESGAEVSLSAAQSIDSSKGNGNRLDNQTHSFMSDRFGRDFDDVTIHTDTEAVQLNRSLNARAFTVGRDIYFNEGQYQPGSATGKYLLAHELTHVIQQNQSSTAQAKFIQRYSGCSDTQDTTVTDDHSRARTMLSNAIDTISSYNGTNPTKVRDALSKHFNGATSNAFATWVNMNLRILWGLTWMAGYECYTGGIMERQWACQGRDLATTFWCVPTVAIRLCPSYFGESDTERSTTMIHEWVHKYGCNFDLGYEHEDDYGNNSTVTQLLNADSFSNLIRDVQ
ncbi:DUF4157 domain-containing protein [Pedobacter sp. HMF7647]|uniref:DUF4157 domain-containing protein n=1 Tax=Hufsiella arboris TaxID=2695275 RepID=A0A7K1Y8E5_9SPHI|nr:DUF4157 domain-containing protein [Hufsiella arboris]MXV50641.1 DUF4157 domain-containing protein [Hufsiella arboris]